MIDILFFYLLMASLFVFGKKAGVYFSPMQLTSLRLLLIGIIFLGYSLAKKHVNWSQVFRHKKLFMGFMLSAIASDLFRFVSLSVLPSSHSALISTTSPFIAAVLSYLVFKECITWQKACALALGAIGILPLIHNNMSALPVSSTDVLIKGYGAAFLSTIGFITVGMFIKQLGVQGYKLLATLGVGLTGAGLLTGCVGMLIEPNFFGAYLQHYNCLPIVVLPSIIGYPLYGYLVCAYPLTLVAFAQLSSPLWAALISWYSGQNDISLPFIISFCVLTIAFVMFYAQERKALKKS